MRKITFTNGSYYHVYNRGVDKRRIFLRQGEYMRFIQTLSNLLNTGSAQQGPTLSKSLAFKAKLSFIGYCLMPNHYHFLIKQSTDNAISDFMHGLNTSYTKYFNISHKRTGRLFEYTFKAVEITSDEQLIHLSRYIHLNPLVSNIVKSLEKYQWSSYLDYIGVRNGKLCQKDEILQLFDNNSAKYQEFVIDHADYATQLHQLKKLVLD